MAAAQDYSDVIFLRGGHLNCHFLKGKPLVHVKVVLMIKTKTIEKGKCFGSPARQRDSLVPPTIGISDFRRWQAPYRAQVARIRATFTRVWLRH